MVAIAFRFPAGRYHANPWSRHVNEADVAWPPDPWRILRALIATWHRKADHQAFPEETLSALIDRLAEHAPAYRLPSAVHAHTRHYMPWFKKGPGDKVLIFDAFARLDPNERLIVAWPETRPSSDECALLAHLVERIGYLGRAESWVEAAFLEPDFEAPLCLDCRPADSAIDPTTGEVGELIPMLRAVPPADYNTIRKDWLERYQTLPRRKREGLVRTLGPRLLDALACDTADWQAAGWNGPPAAERVLYRRPEGALRHHVPRASSHRTSRPDLPTVARFVMAGRPLPRIEDAVKIGELMRVATLSKFGKDDPVPAVISGRDADGRPLRDDAHRHAFFLPEDAGGDGRIDHIVVYASEGFDTDCRRALDQVTRLWLGPRARPGPEEDDVPRAGREEWRLALEGFGGSADFADASRLLATGHTWISSTPYLMPWHAKRGCGPGEQIAREVERRGIGTLVELERVCTIEVHGRERRPVHFHRFRSRRGLTQPDTSGSFWRLTFKEPVTGPLALGFGCHFGLGMFTRSG